METKLINVAILMSTYNGEKYLEEQVQSIFHQKGVHVVLYVRDDGSQDSTLSILEALSQEFEIKIIKGENIGWRRSFMKLVRLVPEIYDYYAFSDQDDVWLENKILSSVYLLEDTNLPALCCSAQTLVDKELKILKQEVHQFPQNYREAMTNISCRGCSEVFNRQLLIMLKKYDVRIDFAHDRWIARVANCLGKIYFDSESYILYRQHDSNSAGNNYNVNIKNRIDRALHNYCYNDFYYWYAKEILNGYDKELTEDKREWLKMLVKARTNLFFKTKLLFSRDFVSESFIGTMLLKAVMILGLYQE